MGDAALALCLRPGSLAAVWLLPSAALTAPTQASPVCQHAGDGGQQQAGEKAN